MGHPAKNHMRLEKLHVQKTRIRVWTGGQGPSLLLLHSGYGDAKFSWQFVWNELAENFRVIAPDLPGFGPHQKDRARPAGEIAALLAEMLHQLGATPAIVVGNSFGGSIAFRFAQEFPTLTRKLILVNGVAMPALPGWLKGILKLPLVHRSFVQLGKGMFYSKRALSGAFHHLEAMPPEWRARLEANATRNTGLVADTWLATEPSETPVHVPIALIWGKDDEMVPLETARQFTARFPQATLHPINNARHIPEVEQPAAFVNAIKKEAAKVLNHGH